MSSTRRVRQETDEVLCVEEQLGDRAEGKGWFSSVAPLAIAAECYIGVILIPYVLPLIESRL